MGQSNLDSGATTMIIPAELEPIRATARRALLPVVPATADTSADSKFLITAKRTDAGRRLPPYYLVYFLLVDLLGFENLGQFEKVSWSVPIDYQGKAFLIEHRKMGLGVFAHDLPADEAAAKDIVRRIEKAVKVARPFFDWMASNAVGASKVNVLNNSRPLFERFSFLKGLAESKRAEAEARKEERIVESNAAGWSVTTYPYFQLRREADWLSISAIEAFFSWTEHVLIHVAILCGRITSAQEVASLAASNWSDKFKCALDVSEPGTKILFDRLRSVRDELRNHVAHGAFGKDGEAFTFHSTVGAVPVLLPHKSGSKKFRLGAGLEFDSAGAMAAIEDFLVFLWSGPREPARLYIQDSYLPVILTMAADRSYALAMHSVDSMKELIDYLGDAADRAANMDW
jgi:hypothetical protein